MKIFYSFTIPLKPLCFPTGLALLLSFFFPITALANNYSDVVFNEIAWMGNQESSSKEWLELYNNTGSLISLDNWKISAADGIPNIVLKSSILPRGFYLLERTSDQTLPGILADQIYTGALENNGENLKLIDQNNNLIDEIIAADGWPGGDNSTKQTMETLRQAQDEDRIWQTSQNPGGTPKAENSLLLALTPVVQKSDYPRDIILEEEKGALAAEVAQKEIKQDEIKESSFSKTFGLALLIAGLSGTAVLMLKRLIGPVGNRRVFR